MVNKNTIQVYLLLLFISMGINQLAKAQNERFHGGRGDGAHVESTGQINFNTVDYVGSAFSVHIDKAIGQADTTENNIINFKLVFSEPVIDLNKESIDLSGAAQAQTVVITGSGTEYNIAVSGMLNNGPVIINIPEGKVHNSVGSPNLPAVIIDNEVLFLGADLTVEITRAQGQEYLTSDDTAFFDITFNENVLNFTESDIELSGTANPQNIKISGTDKIFKAAIYNFQNDGTASINIPKNTVNSIYGKANSASINTQNTVIIDHSRPDVEIKLAEGQTNPAYTLPIKFKVVFSEDVSDFSNLSVNYGGSPNIKMTVSGNGSVYIIAFDSVLTNETVNIYIAENIVHDFAGNGNQTPNYTQNSITFKGVTSIRNINVDDFANIYSKNNNLIINLKELPLNALNLDIYQINGKKVYSKKLTQKYNRIALKAMQLYIISFSGDKFRYTKKVLMR